MAANDIEAARATYGKFMTMLKWGTGVTIAVVALVMILLVS